MKILDIIIPIYGKNPNAVYNNIKNLSRLANNEVGLILVYKNTKVPDFNYDSLRELVSEDIRLIKLGAKVKRTAKVIEGVKQSSAKYVMILDSHHEINDLDFNILINKIKNEKRDYHLIWHEYKVIDLDLGNRIPIKVWGMGPKRVHTAGKQIFLRNALRLDLINYDIVYYDDSTLGFSTSFNRKMKVKKYNLYPYIRVWGGSISSTHNNNSREALKKQQNDLLTMLFNFYDEEKKAISINSKFSRNKVYDYSFYFFFKRVILNQLYIEGKNLKLFLKMKKKEKISFYKRCMNQREDFADIIILLYKIRKETISIKNYRYFWLSKELKVVKYLKKYF